MFPLSSTLQIKNIIKFKNHLFNQVVNRLPGKQKYLTNSLILSSPLLLGNDVSNVKSTSSWKNLGKLHGKSE